MAAPARNVERMRYIDTLRAVAALFVVWLHASSTFTRIGSQTLQDRSWLVTGMDRIDVGHIGVVIFFLISGFVIPFSIRPDRPAPALSFLVKRFFRIFPAYWLSVPLAAAAVFWIWGTRFDTHELLINFTLLQYAFGVRAAEGVYWTLPVELVFYLLCVALLWARSLFATRRIGLLAALLAMFFAAILPTYGHGRALMSEAALFWSLNLSVMLWGMLYRSRCDTPSPARDRIGGVVLWGLLFFYVVILPLISFASTAYMRNTLVTHIIGFAIFLFGTRVRIETRVTDWLGRISYSIYLFHLIVFLTMEWWLLRQPEDSWWRMRAFGVYAGVGVLVVLAVASLVYSAIERPGIRLGHRLAARLSAPRRTAPIEASA
ncbi:MAG TPA: acyltransferase [Rhodanobacteraceae bacterium]|nr:acyltransferase [Rhodanobacteraceae bacterium]